MKSIIHVITPIVTAGFRSMSDFEPCCRSDLEVTHSLLEIGPASIESASVRELKAQSMRPTEIAATLRTNRGDHLRAAGVLDQSFGQFGAFAIRDHPTDHVTAENVENDI